MRRWSILFSLSLLCWQCLAVQQGPAVNPTPPDADDPSGSNIFQILNEQLKHMRSPSQSPEGFGPVSAKQAKICEICKQPLYKHADPNFECIPLGPDGEPRKMLKITTRSAHCPVCDHSFIAALPCNINDHGGRDRDFCAHSLGKYTVFSRVWVCPNCGYAALAENFEAGLDGKPLDEAAKTFVRDSLSEKMKKRMMDIAGIAPKPNQPMPPELLDFCSYIQQSEIADWIKYENALKIYERAKSPRGFLATLYLEAAHACRREVCGEISVPGLHNDLQTSLGKSIRRMNSYLQSECLTIRRRQGAAVLDPLKMETDPNILLEAAVKLIRLGEENYVTDGTPVNPQIPLERFFTAGDMYVLNIRYAGILDRAGRIDDAEKALRRADSYIPDKATNLPQADKEDIQDYFTRQLKLIHGAAEDRIACLKMEKEYLFNAAKFNMTAIRVKEVQFAGEAMDTDPKNAVVLDAAPTAYLLGEMLRRSGEGAAAAAWFDAAGAIVTHRLAVLDKNERDNPQLTNAAPTPESEAIAAKRQRWSDLRDWIKEQRALIKNPPAPEQTTAETVAIVLNAEGVSVKAVQSPTGAATPDAPNAPQTPATVEKKNEAPAIPAPAAGTSGSREQLFKNYYAAILAYREKNQANPPALLDLLNGGFIAREDAHLDKNGKLICPETGEKLGYLRTWEKGDAGATVLFSTVNVRSKRLFADGSIREGDGK